MYHKVRNTSCEQWTSMCIFTKDLQVYGTFCLRYTCYPYVTCTRSTCIHVVDKLLLWLMVGWWCVAFFTKKCTYIWALPGTRYHQIFITKFCDFTRKRNKTCPNLHEFFYKLCLIGECFVPYQAYMYDHVMVRGFKRYAVRRTVRRSSSRTITR